MNSWTPLPPLDPELIGVDGGLFVVEIKGMSTAVLEIAEKAQKLTHEEWAELMEMLEDIEDAAAAKAAKFKGKFLTWEEYKAMGTAQGTA